MASPVIFHFGIILSCTYSVLVSIVAVHGVAPLHLLIVTGNIVNVSSNTIIFTDPKVFRMEYMFMNKIQADRNQCGRACTCFQFLTGNW